MLEAAKYFVFAESTLHNIKAMDVDTAMTRWWHARLSGELSLPVSYFINVKQDSRRNNSTAKFF